MAFQPQIRFFFRAVVFCSLFIPVSSYAVSDQQRENDIREMQAVVASQLQYHRSIVQSMGDDDKESYKFDAMLMGVWDENRKNALNNIPRNRLSRYAGPLEDAGFKIVRLKVHHEGTVKMFEFMNDLLDYAVNQEPREQAYLLDIFHGYSIVFLASLRITEQERKTIGGRGPIILSEFHALERLNKLLRPYRRCQADDVLREIFLNMRIEEGDNAGKMIYPVLAPEGHRELLKNVNNPLYLPHLRASCEGYKKARQMKAISLPGEEAYYNWVDRHHNNMTESEKQKLYVRHACLEAMLGPAIFEKKPSEYLLERGFQPEAIKVMEAFLLTYRQLVAFFYDSVSNATGTSRYNDLWRTPFSSKKTNAGNNYPAGMPLTDMSQKKTKKKKTKGKAAAGMEERKTVVKENHDGNAAGAGSAPQTKKALEWMKLLKSAGPLGTHDHDRLVASAKQTFGRSFSFNIQKNTRDLRFSSPVNGNLIIIHYDHPHGAQLKKVHPAWRLNWIAQLERAGYAF